MREANRLSTEAHHANHPGGLDDVPVDLWGHVKMHEHISRQQRDEDLLSPVFPSAHHLDFWNEGFNRLA